MALHKKSDCIATALGTQLNIHAFEDPRARAKFAHPPLTNDIPPMV
jgi:hypothetical protein